VPKLPSPVEAYNIADLREHARRVLPRGLFEFVDRGTEDEHGLAANRAAFERIRFRPNVLVDVSKRSAATTLFGQPSTMPVVVAPTGAAGLLWLDGEIEVARAARKAGVPFTLSTASIVSMERVAAEAGGRLWFQLYMWPDPEMSYRLVDRVQAAGYEALMVTVDTVATPNREYNPRNGFSLPMRISRRNAIDVAMHPRWFLNVFARYLMRSGIPMLENYPEELRVKLTADPKRKGGLPKNDSLDWDDLRDLRRRWKGPLMIKGILHPDDAARAVDCGVDAVIVSNHGGRNLDAASPTIDALPAIVDRVGGRCDVMLDSGVRRGSDVAKAVALGAKAVMVGRAPLYGVAAAGETGAGQALHFLHDELLRVMGFLGCTSIDELGARILEPATGRGDAPSPAAPIRAPRPIAEPAAATASVHVLAAGKPA
jgi:isopentenyl diphosphate isomerase/L-lactate dehydrogenase-like FMN-dependent dehydrogenase